MTCRRSRFARAAIRAVARSLLLAAVLSMPARADKPAPAINTSTTPSAGAARAVPSCAITRCARSVVAADAPRSPRSSITSCRTAAIPSDSGMNRTGNRSARAATTSRPRPVTTGSGMRDRCRGADRWNGPEWGSGAPIAEVRVPHVPLVRTASEGIYGGCAECGNSREGRHLARASRTDTLSSLWATAGRSTLTARIAGQRGGWVIFWKRSASTARGGRFLTDAKSHCHRAFCDTFPAFRD